MALAPQEIRTFFVTSVTASRRRLFQVEANTKFFIDVLTANRDKGRFLLHAFVVMPDHFHLILTPAPEIPLEKAVQYIKGGFSFRLKSKLDVWERSFAEHRIKDAQGYRQHFVYIEQNPVSSKTQQGRLVSSAAEFAFSSTSRRGYVDPTPAHLS